MHNKFKVIIGTEISTVNYTITDTDLEDDDYIRFKDTTGRKGTGELLGFLSTLRHDICADLVKNPIKGENL